MSQSDVRRDHAAATSPDPVPAVNGGSDVCAACSASHSRRHFLRDATALAVAATGLGLNAKQLAALSVKHVRAPVQNGPELKYPLPADDGATIDKPNEVIVVRWQSTVYAFALSCPHQRTMLKWRANNNQFQCPKHKSKYQPDGTFISGRATRGMDRYPVRIAGSTVIVDRTAKILQDENEQAWNRAKAVIG